MADISVDQSEAVLREPSTVRLRHYPNAISAFLLFGTRLLVAVIQLRLVDKWWGGAYTGLNALSNQILLYVTLLELGLSQSAITLMYEPILQRNFPRVSAMVSAVRHDVRAMAGWGALIFVPVLATYAWFIHGALPFWTVAGTLSLIAASGFIQLAAVHLQVYLNAAEHLDKVNYTLAAGYLAKTMIGLPLAIHFHNYLLLPATVAVLTVGEFASLKSAFRHVFPAFEVVSWRQEARMIRSRAKYVLLQKVGGLSYYQSDFIILSITTSLLVVKDYAKYQYVSAALLSLISTMGSSLTTSVARLQILHHVENRRRQYVTVQFALSVIGAILMAAFCFGAGTVVSLAFGKTPALQESAIVLFGIALFLNIVKSTDDLFVMAKGAFAVGYWIPLIESPVYIVTGVLLSRRIGLVGILMASICTNLVVSVLIKGIVLARPVFEISSRKWFLDRLLNLVKALLLAAPLAGFYAVAPLFARSGATQFAVTSGVALCYGAMTLRFLLSRAWKSGEMAL